MAKFVYDGVVKKIFFFIFGVFIFLSGFLFFKNSVYAAACAITLDPPSLGATEKRQVTIKSQDNCFQNIPYRVAAYPKSIPSLKEAISNVDDIFRIPPSDDSPIYNDQQTLTFNLDLSGKIDTFAKTWTIGGEEYLGSWNILVCLKNNFSDCEKPENLVAKGAIDVIPTALTPTPTPSLDQPIILANEANYCNYQLGSDVKLSIQNLESSTPVYVWWWNEGDKKAQNSILPKNSQYLLEISQEKVRESLSKPTDPEGHLLCIDKLALKIKNEQRTGDNCIRLFFIASSVSPSNAVCTSLNSGTTTPVSLSPCSEWGYLNGTPVPTGQEQFIKDKKCIAVGTAIGSISTNPTDFIKRIFSFVLGISGGIALVLIMISGYKYMASSGNPEALKAATEQLTAAVIGLLLIIFSFVILQVIGVDILRIPGFQP